jgi:hypothetical protein
MVLTILPGIIKPDATSLAKKAAANKMSPGIRIKKGQAKPPTLKLKICDKKKMPPKTISTIPIPLLRSNIFRPPFQEDKRAVLTMPRAYIDSLLRKA